MNQARPVSVAVLNDITSGVTLVVLAVSVLLPLLVLRRMVIGLLGPVRGAMPQHLIDLAMSSVPPPNHRSTNCSQRQARKRTAYEAINSERGATDHRHLALEVAEIDRTLLAAFTL